MRRSPCKAGPSHRKQTHLSMSLNISVDSSANTVIDLLSSPSLSLLKEPGGGEDLPKDSLPQNRPQSSRSVTPVRPLVGNPSFGCSSSSVLVPHGSRNPHHPHHSEAHSRESTVTRAARPSACSEGPPEPHHASVSSALEVTADPHLLHHGLPQTLPIKGAKGREPLQVSELAQGKRLSLIHI